MSDDPYYKKIIEKLNGELDPKVFEECVDDILRKIYPSLVPVKGGGDSGMDGAVADLEGEPFPLVVTTEENVIRNLSKNLRRYLKDGGKRRKAILATSRFLTPRRTQNLFKKAAQLGFTLVQVHSQPSIADLLYYYPNWCKNLLNLDGNPSALSQLPKTNRPEVNENLIAREADLQWLLNTPGDKLLYGHPGSGKTFLLKAYVKAGNGLFVVNDNMGEIISAYRSQQPSSLIIDDAQLSLDIIRSLIHFRKETGASFSILASCWNMEADLLAVDLNLPKGQIHALELLSRDEIVEVIKDAGLIGPDRLIKEIVDQAEGKPGLAATLVHMCLLGDVRSVFLGEALNTSVRRFFEPQLGKRAISVLAAFAVGGNTGVPLQLVSNSLGLNLLEVQEMVVQLASSGIIWDTNIQTLAVFPEALRHNLIKDVFFRGASSLPITSILEQAPNYIEAVHSIIGAYSRGASIPWPFLIGLLETANSPSAWQQFAWTGVNEITWIIENHHDQLINIAYAGLNYAPRKVIPMLLEFPDTEISGGITSEESALKIIENWVKGKWPGDQDLLSDRVALLDGACAWIEKGKDINIGLKAIKIAFDPVCKDMTTDPGSGNRVIIRSAYLSLDEMKELLKQWIKIKRVLRGKEISNWKPLQELFHKWAYHEHSEVHLSDSVHNIMFSFAKECLEDILESVGKRQGLLHWAKQMALSRNFDIEVTIDKEFEILFPIDNRKNHREAEETQRIAVDEQAVRWSKQPVEEVAKKLQWIEQEASREGIRWSKWRTIICHKLSAIIPNPRTWAETFISEKLPADMILPFVNKSSQIAEQGWLDLVKNCLDNPDLRVITISLCLSKENIPDDVIDNALNQLSGYEELIETMCARGQIPDSILKKLLNHPDLSVRASTATGLWYIYDHGNIPDLLKDDWINTIIKSKDDHVISSAIDLYPEIAFHWLMYVAQGHCHEIADFIGSIQTAMTAINDDEKISLLEIIPNQWDYSEVVNCLVGNNLKIFRSLLSSERLKIFHLVPLVWEDSEFWIEKAKIALNNGYTPQEISHSVYGFPFRAVSWIGDESIIRQEWIDRFSKLCSHPDTKVREIGVAGRKNAEEEYQKALRRERNEDIFGYRRYRRI